jgi:uncharacterized protein YndB with AHSA1/START domain
MRTILMTAAVLLGAVGLITAIGFWLPEAHVASVERHLTVAPERLWAILTDIDGFPAWRQDVTRVERWQDAHGLQGWTEHTSNGPMRLVVDRADPPNTLVVRIADPDLPFGGTWTYEIAGQADGSTIRITERGEVYNPIFRFASRFVFGHDRTIRAYLDALERRTAQQEQPHGL